MPQFNHFRISQSIQRFRTRCLLYVIKILSSYNIIITHLICLVYFLKLRLKCIFQIDVCAATRSTAFFYGVFQYCNAFRADSEISLLEKNIFNVFK